MIVIDPGHGGTDPGATSSQIIEKDLNLLISQYQADRFRELGIPTTLTRTTDETLNPTERVRRVLQAYGNNPNIIVLSNHINAGGGTGAEVIYGLRNSSTLARMILEEIEKEGQSTRKYYQRRLPSDPSKDYYFIIRDTGVTQANLIEYGFLDSPGNDVFILTNYWRNLAEAVVRAVTRYLGRTYVSPIGVGEVIHIVVPGDSLFAIARKYGVTVAEIRAVNNLTTDLLSVGQRLIIPVEAPPAEEPPVTPGITYTVKSGDSLWAIARRFNVTVNAIREANNLKTDLLSIGQQLIIPTALPEEEPPPTLEPEVIYTVQKGDNLYTIARQYGVTVNAIREANNLKTDLLSIGQRLIIPTVPVGPLPVEPITYTVQRGDSLWTIAQRFGVTVTELRTLNNLKTDLLSIGQQLLIPTTVVTPEPFLYTVRSGDSLWTIAQRFGTTVSAIRTANNLKTDLLSIGQRLIIPGR
ncbi:MAG: LysM peptidoglycan-binding domain-containing protein [Bacilli bacterium]